MNDFVQPPEVDTGQHNMFEKVSNKNPKPSGASLPFLNFSLLMKGVVLHWIKRAISESPSLVQ